jgi:hypothetical protein
MNSDCIHKKCKILEGYFQDKLGYILKKEHIQSSIKNGLYYYIILEDNNLEKQIGLPILVEDKHLEIFYDENMENSEIPLYNKIENNNRYKTLNCYMSN